ncbi:MAG: hypothetical protein QNL88_14520, partial [Acidobacteriota bacterium]|nr:hypothetical protein [Acidobacteriota bacterium]
HLHHTLTFRTPCPRGATFNIVGPDHLADLDVRVSNNIENGTSVARDSYQHAHPERMPSIPNS